jgi:hypothetical protein
MTSTGEWAHRFNRIIRIRPLPEPPHLVHPEPEQQQAWWVWPWAATT